MPGSSREPECSDSLGFTVRGYRIWGCERADARSHPQIRGSTTRIPKDPVLVRMDHLVKCYTYEANIPCEL
jgi:hypothetical protein